jgi:translation elongation factor EF-Tu-like GTPase
MFKKSREPEPAGLQPQVQVGVSMTACSEFEARFLLTGRHTPVFNHYRPTFRFDSSYVTGTVTFPDGTEMVMPGGDWTEVTVQLAQPALMAERMHFSVHERDRTVGTGQVTKIIK